MSISFFGISERFLLRYTLPLSSQSLPNIPQYYLFSPPKASDSLVSIAPSPTLLLFRLLHKAIQHLITLLINVMQIFIKFPFRKPDCGNLRGYILGTTGLQPHKLTAKPYQNDMVLA
jgi:hypothetical protein